MNAFKWPGNGPDSRLFALEVGVRAIRHRAVGIRISGLPV
jgi:hypothetical protein